LQSGCKSGICGHSASAFGNSVSMPIAALGLLGHCNGYRATVAVICNTKKWPLVPTLKRLCYEMALMMKKLTVTLALHMENPL
jgi:hypothetical protein